ncbi:B9 domain-containing protein 2 [Lobulomyces angularis]|nr:B9 domain-containing protein 2 [Lobulomyces angularis]
MAELHIVGTLIGASQFPASELCCKFSIITGEDWKLLEGFESAQTQVDIPAEVLFKKFEFEFNEMTL